MNVKNHEVAAGQQNGYHLDETAQSSSRAAQSVTVDDSGFKMLGNEVSRPPTEDEVSDFVGIHLSRNGFKAFPNNINRFQSLVVLNLNFNLIEDIPAELIQLVRLKELHLAHNRISNVPFVLCRMSNLELWDLQDNPLNFLLQKYYSGPADTSKFLSKLAAHYEPHSPPCPATRTFCARRKSEVIEQASLMVMSYNVLFSKYATSSHYPYTAPWALRWNYRYGKIMKLITDNIPDVLALQEVGNNVFHKDLIPDLEEFGYTGILALKGRAASFHPKSIGDVDGCAIFYQSSSFELKKTETVYFAHLASKYAALPSVPETLKQLLLNRVMPNDNVALFAVLLPTVKPLMESTAKQIPTVVVCTHLFWDPEFCDVKLIQTLMLIQKVQSLVNQVASEFGILSCLIPVILTGDFNSLPDSGVYSFLNSGFVEKDHPEFLDFRSVDLSFIVGTGEDRYFYRHYLNLKNTIDPEKFSFTNFTNKFTGVIDYIFASSRSLKAVSYLEFDHDWVLENGIEGFPNAHIPSDHLAIAVKLNPVHQSSLVGHPVLCRSISRND